MRMNKRGVYFFVIDVIVAVLIFSVTVAIIASFNTNQPSRASVEETMGIIVTDLMQTEIKDVATSPTLQALRLDGNITNLDLTIDQVLIILFDDGELNNAQNIVAEATAWVSPQFGMNYSIDGTQIYYRPAIIDANDSQVQLSTRKVSVVEANLSTYYPTRVTEVIVWQ